MFKSVMRKIKYLSKENYTLIITIGKLKIGLGIIQNELLKTI